VTRKRFVKRMMGKGYSRNEADAMATAARLHGMSYAKRWSVENTTAGTLHRAQMQITKAARKAARAVRRMGKNIKKTLIPMALRLGAKMKATMAMRTAAPWPAWPGVMVGVDLANGPDVAAEITVAGGAENAD
jgi:hypothetical protein